MNTLTDVREFKKYIYIFEFLWYLYVLPEQMPQRRVVYASDWFQVIAVPLHDDVPSPHTPTNIYINQFIFYPPQLFEMHLRNIKSIESSLFSSFININIIFL